MFYGNSGISYYGKMNYPYSLRLDGGQEIILIDFEQYLIPPQQAMCPDVFTEFDQYQHEAANNPHLSHYLAMPDEFVFTTGRKVTCCGIFVNRNGCRETEKLRIVWFQKKFAFPIDEEVLEQIAKIDWNKAIQVRATPELRA